MKILKTYEAFLDKFRENTSDPLPKPAVKDVTLHKTLFKIPTKVSKIVDEQIFGYYSTIGEIVSKLEEDGFESYWLEEQFNNWKEYAVREPDEEPFEDDFEDEDDFNAEYQEWEDMINKYEEFQNSDDLELLGEYVKDEWNNNWSTFIDEISIDDKIDNVLDGREMKEIHHELKKDWNDSDMIQYFDEKDELNITEMKVIEENFEDGKFTIEVVSTEPLTEENLKIVEDYISGQCSDGWGESFEQHEVGEGRWYVSTWWNDDKHLGKHEIEIEKI